MFEKEAEEWADKGLAEKYTTLEWYARKNNFQKGAEFGYNKANEWHNLKENPNDLPKDSIRVLVLTEEKNLVDVVYIPHEGFKDPDFSNWYTAIAWIEKEKILPKESE